MENKNWYELADTEDIISPSLLVYPDRILHNIRTMIEMAGGAERLRPHIKTHKTAEIIEMQLDQGIKKFKCATIAEAELLAMCKAPDILLAMQPVGANIDRFLDLMSKYPESKFSALIDNPDILSALSQMAKSQEVVVSLWMDINCGMNRTGIVPDENAVALYRRMDADPSVEAKGLHAYDGHIRNTEDYAVGDLWYAVPVHICPTVAKYKNLQVVSEGCIIDSWEVVARNQQISI